MESFAIHRASKHGHLERVRQLIEGGVSVDSPDNDGKTPLHWAAKEGRYEVAELLINSKCDLNLEDHLGYTPVLSAALLGTKAVVELLLQRGARVDCVTHNEWTLLHFASENGWTDIAQWVLGTGEADLNAAAEGYTPLMSAARRGHEDVAALLIRAGTDVNRSDAQKMTALHWAAYNGRTRVVQVLLEVEGLELDPRDQYKETPLHKACFWGHREVVKQLLAAGADTTLKNNLCKTALSEGVVAEKFTLEDIRLFVQHGAFLQDCDYKQISQTPALKESVLKDVDIITQSIVNKFHRQSLPALKGKFTGRLPSIDKFNLLPGHICDVENLVKWDIQANTFCNVVQARPIVLRMMCVESLLAAVSQP